MREGGREGRGEEGKERGQGEGERMDPGFLSQRECNTDEATGSHQGRLRAACGQQACSIRPPTGCKGR